MFELFRGLQLQPSGLLELNFHCSYSFLLVVFRILQFQEKFPLEISGSLHKYSYSNKSFSSLECDAFERNVFFVCQFLVVFVGSSPEQIPGILSSRRRGQRHIAAVK